MKRQVIKENGTVADFSKEKLLTSIIRAYKDTYPERGEAIAINTARHVYKLGIEEWVHRQKQKRMPTKDIRHVTETALMQHCYPIAKQYMMYEFSRAVVGYVVYDKENELFYSTIGETDYQSNLLNAKFFHSKEEAKKVCGDNVITKVGMVIDMHI